MPSNTSKNRGNTAPTSSNSESKPKSDYRLIKDCGYDNYLHFMQSHGLKMHSDDDHAEAKEILNKFREIDEAQEKSGASGK